MFGGDVVEGPLPRLFITNVEEASLALAGNPGKAVKDLQWISRFFMSENIPASAATAQLANPRAPEEDNLQPWHGWGGATNQERT
jgi:hypothetical protein